MNQSFTPSIILGLLIPSVASADVTWDSVERLALSEINPNLGADSHFSDQILGSWSANTYVEGPSVPDLTFERASATARHSSNVGLGSVPWAVLTGYVIARHAVPASFGLATARIQLTATFTLSESTGYEIRNLRGSGFVPEAQIVASLTRGTEVIFSKLGPVAYSETGVLSAGVYKLSLTAEFANGDTGSSGTACDLRFTLPSPSAALLLLGPAFARRRRIAAA